MQDIDTTQPLVSVVIATYNMARYLDQAIDSILVQQWRPLEIIVVNDGSTDDTDAVMKKYADYPQVRYIATENQGQPKAKNTGLRAARGKFIAFCDADDLWEPDKLALQMPLFSDPKVGVVYSEISNIDEHNRRYEKPPVYKRHVGDIKNHLLLRNFVPFGTAVIRRACVEKNGLFDEQFRMGIDWDLWLRYSLDWHFTYVPQRTYIYREWSGQMSTNYRGRYDHAFRILDNFLKHHGHHFDPALVRKARADMYIGQGNAIAVNESAFIEPLKNYLNGVFLCPSYSYGWKSIAKLILGRHKKQYA